MARITTYVEIDIETGKAVKSIGYDYDGPIAQCGGGGGGGDVESVDYDYNARMATIAEKQNEWAEEYFNMWKNNGFKAYEIEQVQANRKALPYESRLYTNGLQAENSLLNSEKLATQNYLNSANQNAGYINGQLASANSLLPAQTELANKQLATAIDLEPQQAALASKFLQESTNGLDINGRVGRAQADVVNAWKGTQDATNREMARMGVNPNSGRFAGTQAVQDATKAAQIADARNRARMGAEDQNYERLKTAVNFQADTSAVNPINTMGARAGETAINGTRGLNDMILQGIGLIRG